MFCPSPILTSPPQYPPLERNTMLYSLMQLKADCTTEEIETQFRKLAYKHHPDRCLNGGKLFKRLNQAKAVLSNPDDRKLYDRFRAQDQENVLQWCKAQSAFVGGFVDDWLTAAKAWQEECILLDEEHRQNIEDGTVDANTPPTMPPPPNPFMNNGVVVDRFPLSNSNDSLSSPPSSFTIGNAVFSPLKFEGMREWPSSPSMTPRSTNGGSSHAVLSPKLDIQQFCPPPIEAIDEDVAAPFVVPHPQPQQQQQKQKTRSAYGGTFARRAAPEMQSAPPPPPPPPQQQSKTSAYGGRCRDGTGPRN